jgi:hypothetical protein
MVNRINNNLPPFLVKSEDTSKSNLFSVSSVNQGVRLSSYGYSDSTVITDPISLRSGKSLFDSIESPTDLINIIDLGKSLNDSTNPIIDLLNYNIIKSFTQGIDPITDNLIYNIAKALSDSAISSDLINTLNFDKILSDIINVSDNFSFLKSKILDSAGTAETLDLLGIDDGITYGLSKIFNDSVNATEILESLYAVGRQPLDSSSASDINTISFGKNIFDSSTITESHIYTLDKILADSSLISELLANSLLKPFTDSESATDFVSLEPGKIFFDSIESPTDLINTFAVVKNLNDSINSVEVLNYNIDKEIQNEILSPIDLLDRDFLKTLADSSFISDLPQLNLNKPNFADDSVNVNDAGLISVQDYFLEIYVSDLQPYVEKSNTTF